jgi:uncharacterized protein
MRCFVRQFGTGLCFILLAMVPVMAAFSIPCWAAGEIVSDLTKKAEAGDATAQFDLGRTYCFGLGGVPKDPAQALHWFRKAAEQGHAQAEGLVGVMYGQGLGVPKDSKTAVDWFRKAADHGDRTAQRNLGLMYRDGLGIPRDYKEAYKWFLKSAENGNASAQYCIGMLYRNGQGVPEDRKKARSWFRKAADAGNEPAKKALRIMDDEWTPEKE